MPPGPVDTAGVGASELLAQDRRGQERCQRCQFVPQARVGNPTEPCGQAAGGSGVATLGLPVAARQRLESLTPAAYTGLAEALARSR